MVVVAADVDIRGPALEKQGERLEDALGLLLVAAHRETGESNRYDQTVELKLQPERPPSALERGKAIAYHSQSHDSRAGGPGPMSSGTKCLGGRCR